MEYKLITRFILYQYRSCNRDSIFVRGSSMRQNFSITPVIATLRARCTLIERHVVVDWHKSFFDVGGNWSGRYRGSKIFEYRNLHGEWRSIRGARFRKQIHQIEIEETDSGVELQIWLETGKCVRFITHLFEIVIETLWFHISSIKVGKYWKYWFLV